MDSLLIHPEWMSSGCGVLWWKGNCHRSIAMRRYPAIVAVVLLSAASLAAQITERSRISGDG